MDSTSDNWSPVQVEFQMNELIPEDVIIVILAFVPVKDLLKSCQRVCRKWKQLINEQSLWRIKCSITGRFIEGKMGAPPNDFKKFFFKNPYRRNLIQNPCGEMGFQHWNILQNGGDGFTIEKTPVGCQPFEAFNEGGKYPYNSCFATSYTWCRKNQMIDLLEMGLTTEILDEIRPEIEVFEWTVSRYDCGCIYKLKVKLLAEDKQVVIDEFKDFHQEPQWQGNAWTKISYSFIGYGPGVRYILFQDAGKDTQFWKGHYGSKMSAATVRFRFK